MAFTPSAKMIAKRRDIDIASLIDILSYRRPYNSEGEQEFLNVVLDPIEGMMFDDFGNRYIRIGESDVMWSCHTDTVHAPIKDGVIRQNLKWDGAGNILGLNEGKPGQCLGADDGAGIWLMLEMIKAQVPGLYIFHRGEEVGGKGSRWIEKNTPDLLEGINYAIAFDRKDLNSIITFQGGTRCCSDAFGMSLGAAISRIDGLDMKLDTGGSFTDTAVYTDLVAECTNVSVGYYSQHGPRETLDVRHMIRLRDALLQLNPKEDFVIERKAGDRESKWATSNYNWARNSNTQQRMDQNAWGAAIMGDEEAYEKWMEEKYGIANPTDDAEQSPEQIFTPMLGMVKTFPEIAVALLMDSGMDQWDFADATLAHHEELQQGDDSDLAEVVDLPETVECQNCTGKVDMADVDEQLKCPYCWASLNDALGEALERANA